MLLINRKDFFILSIFKVINHEHKTKVMPDLTEQHDKKRVDSKWSTVARAQFDGSKSDKGNLWFFRTHEHDRSDRATKFNLDYHTIPPSRYNIQVPHHAGVVHWPSDKKNSVKNTSDPTVLMWHQKELLHNT